MSLVLRAMACGCRRVTCWGTLLLAVYSTVAFQAKNGCTAAEGETGDLLPDLEEIPTSGPYCGVYGLAACLNAAGIKCDVTRMWKPEYIGSRQGSTAAELIRAATDSGACATAYHHLTHRELGRCRYPLLLHTRSNRGGPAFDHWVAFLGYEGSRLRILDAPNPVQTYSPADVLAIWDGLAIAVSKEPIDDSLLQGAWIDSALILTASGLAMWLIAIAWQTARGRGPCRWSRRMCQETGFVLGTCLVLALLFHAGSEVGFLANPSAVAEVVRRFHSVDGIPELSLQEMELLTLRRDTVLLDARLSIDFKTGALPGAVSLPINSTLADRREILSPFNRAQVFVVYCQSEHCAFADRIAQFLAFNGYPNLYIYRGGYREWSRRRLQANTGLAE